MSSPIRMMSGGVLLAASRHSLQEVALAAALVESVMGRLRQQLTVDDQRVHDRLRAALDAAMRSSRSRVERVKALLAPPCESGSLQMYERDCALARELGRWEVR